ncbi:MAG TPA: hypothetical protein VJ063_21895 [Verrucomicrobiae bacterium]|nr:hypothetical protein [Verrucomicrobiae bacterium]
MTPLTIIDSRSHDWKKQVHNKFESGRNFIVLLADPEQQIAELCAALKSSSPSVLVPLQKWAIYAVRDLLQLEQVQNLLDAVDRGETGYFIEQIKLCGNRPPCVGPFLIYCELGGIISEHKDEEDAKQALIKYFQTFMPAKNYPLAGIYRWDRNAWTKTKIAF